MGSVHKDTIICLDCPNCRNCCELKQIDSQSAIGKCSKCGREIYLPLNILENSP